MVIKIKLVDVYSQEAEEANEPDIESYDDADDSIEEEDEEDTPPKITEGKSRKKKQVLDMPTTDKIMQQVQCFACGKSMSAKI